MGAALAVLMACSPSPEHTDAAALEAALAGTRSVAAPHGAGAEPPPLADAGPHRSTIRLSLTLGAGGSGYRRITIERVIDRGPGGAYRIKDRRRWTDPALPVNGYDDGRDILYDGKGLYIRRLGAPWMARETVGGHPERLLRDAYAMSPSIHAAFDHAIAWSPVADAPPALGAANVSWFEAKARPAALAPKPATGSLAGDRDHAKHWTRWWGATHEVETVQGRMARLGDSNHWVAGTLELSGKATVDAITERFQLRYAASVEPRTGSDSFKAPADAQPATRPRTWRMVEDVLGDALEPIYRR
jgi:hypothetical protein